MRRFTPLSAFLMLVSLVSGAGRAHAHGDHDAAPPAAIAHAPRLQSLGSNIELVATSEGHRLTIYLDRSLSNEPVDNASIEVSGDGIPTAAAKAVGPGTYELEADWVDEPGTRPLIFAVTTIDDADLLTGTWTVQPRESQENSSIASDTLAHILTRTDVLATLVGAVVVGFVLALAVRLRGARKPDDDSEGIAADVRPFKKSRAFRSAAEVLLLVSLAQAILPTGVLADPGHDHGDGGHAERAAGAAGNTPRRLPDGTAFIPKPTQRLLEVRTQAAEMVTTSRVRTLIGTVIPDPSSVGQVQAPMDGQIELSERGISHAGQKVNAGEVLALLSPAIPVADLGTMQQLRAEVEGKLAVAEQKLDRLTRIAGVVAKSQIDDTKAELVALREQKRVLEPKDTQRIQLKAPVSGIISVANVRPGQVVTARDTLFEIVDPDRLWVEGIGGDTHGQGDVASARAVDNEGHALRLDYVGQSPALRQQARPFLFRIAEPHPDLVIGAAVKILLQSQQAADGIVVPAVAVVRGGNGLSQVWIKDGPERFRPAPVKTEPLDGERVLILGGIKSGERVVTSAAELINQIR